MHYLLICFSNAKQPEVFLTVKRDTGLRNCLSVLFQSDKIWVCAASTKFSAELFWIFGLIKKWAYLNKKVIGIHTLD